MRDDYYELLGLNNGATSKEVTKAFRKASLRLHPDKVINSSDAHKNWARDAFDAVKEAYEILSDPKARRKYDVRASWMASHSDQILPADQAGPPPPASLGEGLTIGPRANLLPVFSLVRGQQPTATAAWEASPRPRFQRLGSSGAEAAPSLSTALASAVHPATPATPLGGQASPQRKRVAFKNSCAFPADAEFSLRSPATPSMSLRPFSNTG
eukprot:CAMPEP_0115166768 /NCGR_PEP_ID=MMETSP0227-20121206/74295_1 /TAXON_ID=89957 /ORGANISM="Polarella glacialis, Strain CCMP 1383" /LENGTH=211 /DNA_ID=CAMNT_0002579315 /DNA_START=98 /DNA_END=732 /DNA_ORIENTATION=-